MSLRVAAILSLLHEPAGANSATRRFRDKSVLQWTIDRIGRATSVERVGILCWDDQLPAVQPITEREGANVELFVKGPRRPLPELDRVAVGRSWSDGWRGGLHGTCSFDAGFYGPWTSELADTLAADAVLLVPPASALVDPAILDALVERAVANPSLELIFSAAAPGLGGALVTRPLLATLVANRSHPGRLLHYMPERPVLDPVGSDACVTVPARVSRTQESFLLDSDRRIERFTSATRVLNGALASSAAEDIVARLQAEPTNVSSPRDVTIELNVIRLTSPSYMTLRQPRAERASLNLRTVVEQFEQLTHTDDVRLTIGGRGDPLCSPILFDVVEAARAAGIDAIHIETDLAEANPKHIVQLASADVDLVSIYLPALSPAAYATIMGVDAMPRVMENLKTFVTVRAARGRGAPLVVPTFVKLASNLAEMDAWYDQWLGAIGAAAIVGPRALGMPSLELADLSPATHARGTAVRPVRRFVRYDGSVTYCDVDAITPAETEGAKAV